jgi:hypothetical protein
MALIVLLGVMVVLQVGCASRAPSAVRVGSSWRCDGGSAHAVSTVDS